MPDVQPQDTSKPQDSPAIADLAPPGQDTSVSGLVSSLTALDRQKLKTDTDLSNQFNAQSAKDKAIRDEAFRAEGAAAADIPRPWDADKEHRKYESNPIEGFGSAGGLFAMVASAFTKAPMQSAIEGMAGAITSIQNGNEKAYERAYDSFKTNVKLAEQRFKTQHELYEDALQLGAADAAASSAKFHNAATKFGDQQMLTLAEHGMIKEIYELQAARAKANDQMIESADKITLHTVQKAAVDAIKKGFQPTGDKVQDAVTIAAQIQNVYDGGRKYGSAEQEGVGRIIMESQAKQWTWQETTDKLAEFHQNLARNAPNQQGYYEAREREKVNYPDGVIPPERDAQLLQMFGLKAEPHAASGAAAAEKEKNKETKAGLIVDGIESGKQTPATTGLYGLAPEVRAEAAKRGVDLEKLQLQELAAKKQIQSLNGPQMTRFVGLATSVDNTIDEANRLAKEMGNSGISKLNKAKLEALIGYEGNSERGKLATRYLTTINTLKEEFANLANGGYAPTEPAWRLANEQINANYGSEQLTSSLKEVQRLIRYRINAIPGLAAVGPGSENQYMPKAKTEASIPEAAIKELKEGVVTKFANGQKWTLRAGKPEQVNE